MVSFSSTTGWQASVTLFPPVLMSVSEESSSGIARGIATMLLTDSKVSYTLQVTENDGCTPVSISGPVGKSWSDTLGDKLLQARPSEV